MSQRPREVRKLYIATQDYLSNDKMDGNVKIPRGSLLSQLPEEARTVPSKRPSLWAKVLDTEQVLWVEPRGLQEVSERTAGLLEAVTNCEERLALLSNPRQLHRLSEIRRGDWVRVQSTSASNEKVPGIVRYCGPLGKSKGILFGVELVGSAAGKGFTDGSFNGQKLFNCQENCGVFVPISRIEPSDGALGQEGNSGERVQPRTASPGEGRRPMLELGTKVYFRMGEETPPGTVVFCDSLPKKEDHGIYVGIHLDGPVGSWDGYFKGTKLCSIPSPAYGLMLPISKVYRVPSPIIQQIEKRNCLPRGGPDKNQQNRLTQNRPKEVNRPIEDKEKSTTSWFTPEQYTPEGREDTCLHAEVLPTRTVRPLRIAAPDDAAPSSLKFSSPRAETSPMRSPGHASLDSLSPEVQNETHWPPLELNSMVEVQDPPIYGVIRWIGELPDLTETMAGLEVEDPMPTACTDGMFKGVRYFQCAPNKALFVRLRICRPDSRFASLHLPTNQINRCNSIAFKDYTSERVEEDTPPPGWREGGEQLIGWKKGIQGHCNSCYLDATLFSMFAFTPVLDTMLLRPQDKNDTESYAETRDLLRTEIVNPLRKHGYVCATKVMALRRILEAAGQSSGFTSEEKDPEEFLNQLFQVLKVEPLFKIRSSGKDTHGCIFYQIFMERKQLVSVPSVQQLLEWSLVTSDLKFTEAPSCLILQMPRNGKNFKMFTTILPTLELDITDLLEDTPRQCCICESLALVECKECYEDPSITPGRIKQYCSICSKQVHRPRRRTGHQPQGLRLPEELAQQMDFPGLIPRQAMQLFAVLCIETSHYVAFTKHGPRNTDWRFFDSMADREGGQNGFNIPRVVPCPEVAEYLNMTPDDLRDLDPRAMPVYARRLLSDAYMCLYHSPTLSLYK